MCACAISLQRTRSLCCESQKSKQRAKGDGIWMPEGPSVAGTACYRYCHVTLLILQASFMVHICTHALTSGPRPALRARMRLMNSAGRASATYHPLPPQLSLLFLHCHLRVPAAGKAADNVFFVFRTERLNTTLSKRPQQAPQSPSAWTCW